MQTRRSSDGLVEVEITREEELSHIVWHQADSNRAALNGSISFKLLRPMILSAQQWGTLRRLKRATYYSNWGFNHQ